VYRQVTRRHVHPAALLCDVTVIQFAANAKETLRASVNQAFFVKRAGWRAAASLNFRCVLYGERFGNLAIAEAVVSGEQAPLHSLEVDGLCTYYVGRWGVWVHSDAV